MRLLKILPCILRGHVRHLADAVHVENLVPKGNQLFVGDILFEKYRCAYALLHLGQTEANVYKQEIHDSEEEKTHRHGRDGRDGEQAVSPEIFDALCQTVKETIQGYSLPSCRLQRHPHSA